MTEPTTTIDQERLASLLVNVASLEQNLYQTRAKTIGRMYYSEDGDDPKRDIWAELGYKRTLKYSDYHELYTRMHIARKIINAAPDDTWRGGFTLLEGIGEKAKPNTPFTKAWEELDTKMRLTPEMAKADRLSRIGHYGVFYFGVGEIEGPEEYSDESSSHVLHDPQQPKKISLGEVSSVPGIGFVRALSEGQAEGVNKITDPYSPKYGFPETYNIELGDESQQTVNVHHSRLIHIAEDPIEGLAKGTPTLQPVFNLLYDLLKTLGGSAEAFWRTADRGIHANAEDGTLRELIDGDDDALLDQIEAYVHNLQRYIVTDGVTVTPLGSDPVDPSNIVDKIVEMIAAAVSIPQRLLVGSERGELASSQDETQWNKAISHRQRNHVEHNIIRPVIDRLIEWGVLPEPKKGNYSIEWPELYGEPLSKKAITAKMVAEAMAVFVNAGLENYINIESFVSLFLDMKANSLIEIISEEEREVVDEDQGDFGPQVENLTPDGSQGSQEDVQRRTDQSGTE